MNRVACGKPVLNAQAKRESSVISVRGNYDDLHDICSDARAGVNGILVPSEPAAQQLFSSFFQGGFECATHRRHHIGQIDVLHATQHDVRAREDYELLAEAGIRTVRDGLRWHRIERTPGFYDWSSFLPMLSAAIASGTQVIWDLCHWGVPEGLDPFSPDFITRFERFAAVVAHFIREQTDVVPFFCPVNEISFWSWIGGDRGIFFPYAQRRGGELKRQLASAAIAAVHAVRAVVPQARFLQCEPIINITGEPKKKHSRVAAARHTASQFEAWDMIAGRLAPELGGSEDCLDVLGCNYYWNNQWVHNDERAPIGHAQHRPLHRMLVDLHERYHRPVVLSETGAEDGSAIGWLGMVCAEVREAKRQGADLQGICLYPAMDYPGWDDKRHCHCGLIAVDGAWDERSLRLGLTAELRWESEGFRAFFPPKAGV